MKLISWNVNGLRAVVNKGFKEFFKDAQGAHWLHQRSCRQG